MLPGDPDVRRKLPPDFVAQANARLDRTETGTDPEFRHLLRRKGRVQTRTMLLEAIWGDAAYRDPRTIDVHIRHLREKLESVPKEPEYLFTVRGVGYMLTADVTYG